MATDSPRLAIVGSGFSGLCLGIRLKQLGIDCFTIFEKADRLGGTWRDNTYPGAACDVPAFSYCFSFEQKTDWSRKWAPQAEILAYMEHCARKYDLHRHIRFARRFHDGLLGLVPLATLPRDQRGHDHHDQQRDADPDAHRPFPPCQTTR